MEGWTGTPSLEEEDRQGATTPATATTWTQGTVTTLAPWDEDVPTVGPEPAAACRNNVCRYTGAGVAVAVG